MSELVVECVNLGANTKAKVLIAGDVEWHDFDCDRTSIISTLVHDPETSSTLGELPGGWYEYILSDDHRSGEGTLGVAHLAQTVQENRSLLMRYHPRIQDLCSPISLCDVAGNDQQPSLSSSSIRPWSGWWVVVIFELYEPER